VVAAAGNIDSTPKGPAIHVFFNFGGFRYKKCRQHRQEAHHRRLDKLATCCQYFSGDTYQGATPVNTITASRTSFEGIFFGVLALLKT
jgi:hypothetical protein